MKPLTLGFDQYIHGAPVQPCSPDTRDCLSLVRNTFERRYEASDIVQGEYRKLMYIVCSGPRYVHNKPCIQLVTLSHVFMALYTLLYGLPCDRVVVPQPRYINTPI